MVVEVQWCDACDSIITVLLHQAAYKVSRGMSQGNATGERRVVVGIGANSMGDRELAHKLLNHMLKSQKLN